MHINIAGLPRCLNMSSPLPLCGSDQLSNLQSVYYTYSFAITYCPTYLNISTRV